MKSEDDRLKYFSAQYFLGKVITIEGPIIKFIDPETGLYQ